MKKTWVFLRKYAKELILLLAGFFAGVVIFTRKRERDLLSDVGNRIDSIEQESGEKLDEFKRKLEIIQTISDKLTRMEKLLELKKEIDEL